MTAAKTNEREGTRAVLHWARMSPYKVREVLDLIRGQHVEKAADRLRLCERDAADQVGKVLASAVANAVHNDSLDAEELFVSACFADEGPTLKRYRYRARGRTARIRKRTSHITVIVSRLPEDDLRRLRARKSAETAARRARRVAGGRRGDQAPAPPERAGRFRRTRRGATGDVGTGAEESTVIDEATTDEPLVGDEAIETPVEPATEAGTTTADDETTEETK